MEIFLLISFIVIVLFFILLKRGKRSVQAYVYLVLIDQGKNISEANSIALSLSNERAGNLNRAMLECCKTHFHGKQLPMLAYARSQGFEG